MMDIPLPEKKEIKPRQPMLTLPVFMLIAVVAVVAFLGGIWFSDLSNDRHNNKDFQVFWDSWSILEREYYYDLPDDPQLIHSALQGMFNSVGNRYTFFAPPAAAEVDRERTAGEFGGIGAYVSQNPNGQLVITKPFDGMPAAEAGLEANDVILEVNGTPIEGWTFENAVDLLRGEIGSKVTLLVLRPNTGAQFSVEITRARVELPITVTAMYGDVGYVALAGFNQKATTSLEQDIKDLKEQGAKALILDLRGNPGGLVDQAVGVSDLFLGEGVVLSQKDRKGEESMYYSDGGDLAEDMPLVVLIDGGSASAAEVVAGALRDHGRAVLIGQTSFGKGSVQQVYNMADGSQVHVTTAIWLPPNGNSIDGKGLKPDITVTVPDQPVPDHDPFIEMALAYFKNAGAAQGD